jgi:hypothetical protein
MHPRRTSHQALVTADDRNSQMMRRVNTAFSQYYADEEEPGALHAFFCECSSERCYAVVWLTTSAFETRVADEDGWIVVTGHTGSPEPPSVETPVHRSPGNSLNGQPRRPERSRAEPTRTTGRTKHGDDGDTNAIRGSASCSEWSYKA